MKLMVQKNGVTSGEEKHAEEGKGSQNVQDYPELSNRSQFEEIGLNGKDMDDSTSAFHLMATLMGS